MTTTKIKRTSAEARKETAAERLTTLETEQAGIPTRQRETEADIERLHQEIVTAERAGAAAKTLTTLRQQRAEAQQVLDDLPRMLPSIDREVDLAKAELRAAKIAVHAEEYNELVEKQNALKELLCESIDTIVETLRVKEGMVKQQQKILLSDLGALNYLYPERSLRSLVEVRQDYLNEIAKRLEDKNYNPNSFSLEKLDSSCRAMHPDGRLE